MDTSELISKLKKISGLVAVSQFGSFGTELWIKDRSDIDLAIIVGVDARTGEYITYMDTLKLEDLLLPIFKEYYSYENIHMTFLLFKDFISKYSRMAVDSNCIFIVDDNMWYDYQHYVLKYARNNREFEKILKMDEQYTYFGGIIDESLL